MKTIRTPLCASLVLALSTSSLVCQDTGSAEAKPQGSETTWTGVLDEKSFAALHELKKGEAPKLFGEDIRVGGEKAYLSLPRDAKGKPVKPESAVVVIHEWWGLNANVKHWADRLAADGHAALAVDLYKGVVATTRDKALESMQSVDPDAATKTLLAAYDFLGKDERVRAKKRGCIGWCFGGGWSLRLAMAAPELDAAVIYYGRLVTDPEKLAPIGARMLGVFGEKDRGIPPRAVEAFEAAMKKAGKKIEVLSYPANHAFANPSSARYDAKHAAAAWKRVRAFLRESLRADAAAPRLEMRARDLRASYVLPAGWAVKAKPGMMRNVDFELADAKDVQCYVSVLPGAAGGLGPNVNRWRAQLGQDAMDDDAVAALEQIDMLGTKAHVASIDGAYTKRGGAGRVDPARLVGVVCSLEEQVVFVKLIGPRDAVAKQEKALRAFCASLQRSAR